MPRAPRNRSKSGIYHIIMRGINRQTIFEDEEIRYICQNPVKAGMQTIVCIWLRLMPGYVILV